MIFSIISLIQPRFMTVGQVSMDMDEMGSFGMLPEIVEKDSDMAISASTVDKGGKSEVEHFSLPTLTPSHSPVPHPDPNESNNAKSADGWIDSEVYSNAFVASTSATSSGMQDPSREAHQLRKEDILKRANERRQELQEELDTVKRRLWETTIEQAALIHLTRKLDSGSDLV